MAQSKARAKEWSREHYLANIEEKRAVQRDYNATHREERRAYYATHVAERKAWNEANREKIRAQQKLWRDGNPERNAVNMRRQRLKRKYGLTPKAFDAMWIGQGECCAIPGCDSTCPPLSNGRDRRYVDHDHATGMVRGIVCHDCNMALGHVFDSVERLAGMITYLARAAASD